MQTAAKPSRANQVLVLLVIVAAAVVAIKVYRATSPTYDFWDCLFNPVGCATQGAIFQLLGMIELVVNPFAIVVLAVLYVIARKMKK